MTYYSRSPLAVESAIVGWGIAGAGAVAALRGVAAIRSQPPLPGRSGRNQTAGASVQVIYSRNAGRARVFADRHAIPHTADTLEKLLNRTDIQCVYVASHPRHHAETVLAALQAGKHVLCEPPIADSFEEAERLVMTAANRGLVLAVNHHRRAEPALRRARSMLERGDLGDFNGLRAVNAAALPMAQQTWRLQAPWGGVLWEKGLHTFDLVHYVSGERIAEVQTAAGLHLLGSDVVEEAFTATRLARSRAVAQTHDSFLAHHLPSAVELHGSHASAVVLDAFSNPFQPVRATLLVVRNGAARPLELSADERGVDTFAASVASVHAALREGSRPLASAEDGLAAMAAALAALESIHSGMRVAVRRSHTAAG